jgi:translocation and assembly module TamA
LQRTRIATALLGLCALLSASAHAGVSLKFEIENGTQQMEDNLRAFLSVSRYEKRDDLDAQTLSRLESRIPAEGALALQPLGYYEPKITFTSQQKGKDWQVNVKVQPGPPVRLAEVKVSVTGEGKDESHIRSIIDAQPLQTGDRLDHGAYEQYKNALLHAATTNGYIDATWTTSDLLIDAKQRTAFITLQLETGARYYFGDINITQETINAGTMQKLLRMRKGDPYSLDAVLQSQYVLDDSQYFSSSEIISETPDPGTHTVPITVRAKTNKRNNYAISVGYGTDTRARGKLTWTDRLVNRAGHRARLELTGSAVGYEAAAHYIVPVGDVALEKIEFILANTKQELDTATSYRNELTTELTQVLGSWQRVLFTRLSQERSVYTDSTIGEVKTFLIIPGITYSTLPTHILGQDQRRYIASVTLSGSPSSLGSGASYLQLVLQGERIFDINQNWHLRLRSQMGFTSTDNFAKVPASSRFYAGGDNSVRGFGLNELSPVNEDKTTGGRYLLYGTVEVERDLSRNFRWATFYDIGNAINKLDAALQYSVGVGLRWHISIASFGLDVAQPLSMSGRSPRLHLHISTLF